MDLSIHCNFTTKLYTHKHSYDHPSKSNQSSTSTLHCGYYSYRVVMKLVWILFLKISNFVTKFILKICKSFTISGNFVPFVYLQQ